MAEKPGIGSNDQKLLRDGTVVNWCGPHRRWEWDCGSCGHANPSTAKTCEDCGEAR
jgi:hypothetical protein